MNSSKPRHSARSARQENSRRKFAGKGAIIETARERAHRMIAKWLLQTLIWIVAMGALLFVPAGTLHWPAAWVFLATLAVIGLAGGWWLARTDPALFAERMRPPMRAEQPAADKRFVVVFGLTALIWLIVIGLDERCTPPASRSPCRRSGLR